MARNSGLFGQVARNGQIMTFCSPGLHPLTPVPFEMALRYKTRFTETVRLF